MEWYSHRDRRLVKFIRFEPGTGSTLMVLDEENFPCGWVFNNERWLLGHIMNDYLFVGFEGFLERIDNPKPTQELQIFLRKTKLARIWKK